MATLNILCAICSEYFKNADVIYTTRCGHVFHKFCLFQWLESSQTCPQCRNQCKRHYCHQLYVNFVEATLGEEEIDLKSPKTYYWIYVHQYMDFREDMSFAFKYGLDEEGNDIYAARGRFNGDLIPCYYVPSKKLAIAPWGFQSHQLIEDIELLDVSSDDAEYKWVASCDGNIPENAFATGHTGLGDILYTARAKHEDKILYGKLHQRYNQAYVPYKGKEVSNANYEVLVRIPKEIAPPIEDNVASENVQLFN